MTSTTLKPSHNKLVANLAQRMSLRPPQHESLDILARIADAVPLTKEQNLDAALAAVKAIAPTLTDFERGFPSLAFALATGVGKTRLMGAFIAYLANEKKLKHFLVISPNRTIYTKLIADFTPNTPKYVFTGLGTLVSHYVVTGDNFEHQHHQQLHQAEMYGEVEVNIFNIAKLTGGARGETEESRKVRAFREVIGTGYFEYLQKLPDLVVIMDEAHRYRAQGASDVLNELKPVLGLELTATPVISAANDQRFKNVVYSYPLAKALADGFVKIPAVATRPDFKPKDYNKEELERIKLEDAIRLHEDVKVQLAIHAEQTGKPTIKPFILVIAENITEASKHKALLESPTFFEGRYEGKVIQVDSGNRPGDEKDDVVEKLLSVEDPKNPIEIVVHVNMLKEGWDVTNLFTIVPLRAANARVLIEQSIGRGLRLPYGTRTGVPACDRLTIVAHDKFQEIIDDSQKADSPIKAFDIVPIPEHGTIKVVSGTAVDATLFGSAVPGAPPTAVAVIKPEHVDAAKAVQAAIAKTAATEPTKAPNSQALDKPDMQGSLFNAAKAALPPGSISDADLKVVTQQVVTAHVAATIDIPLIVVYPDPEVTTFGYKDFDLDPKGIRPQPVDREILVKSLHDTSQADHIAIDEEAVEEQRLEDFLVRGLIDFDDVDYDQQSDLLYKLSGQMVAHLRSYLKKDGATDDEAVRNVIIVNQKSLAHFIHEQMQRHSWEKSTRLISTVTSGFRPVKPIVYQAPEGTTLRDVRATVESKHDIKSMVFNGFSKKCLQTIQKFDSDAERRFALVCEDDATVLKWVKPAREDNDIKLTNGSLYHVDFVVETKDMKYMIEVKRGDQLEQEDVKEKAKAGRYWCQEASHYARKNGDKEWLYLLIPDHSIKANSTFAGLAAFK